MSQPYTPWFPLGLLCEVMHSNEHPEVKQSEEACSNVAEVVVTPLPEATLSCNGA